MKILPYRHLYLWMYFTELFLDYTDGQSEKHGWPQLGHSGYTKRSRQVRGDLRAVASSVAAELWLSQNAKDGIPYHFETRCKLGEEMRTGRIKALCRVLFRQKAYIESPYRIPVSAY